MSTLNEGQIEGLSSNRAVQLNKIANRFGCWLQQIRQSFQNKSEHASSGCLPISKLNLEYYEKIRLPNCSNQKSIFCLTANLAPKSHTSSSKSLANFLGCNLTGCNFTVRLLQPSSKPNAIRSLMSSSPVVDIRLFVLKISLIVLITLKMQYESVAKRSGCL